VNWVVHPLRWRTGSTPAERRRRGIQRQTPRGAATQAVTCERDTTKGCWEYDKALITSGKDTFATLEHSPGGMHRDWRV